MRAHDAHLRHRIFYDFEFYENGRTIDPISLGMVSEMGHELYVQFVDFDGPAVRTHEWLREHVIPALRTCPASPAKIGGSATAHVPLWARGSAFWMDFYYHSVAGFGSEGEYVAAGTCGAPECPWRTKRQAADDVLRFVSAGKVKAELWGHYCAYDHVALAQLFGPMIALPSEWLPMYTRDLKQWCDALGDPRLPEQGKGEHNALADAHWNRTVWRFLADRADP